MKFRKYIAALALALFCSTVQASTVELTWTPNTEVDLAGYKVYYVADSTNFEQAIIIDVKNITTYAVTELDPLKSYSFVVTAYNTAGMESPFSNMVTVAELTSPVVSLNTSILNGTLTATATATDNVGVTKVEFYINGTLVTTSTSTPYVYAKPLSTITPGTCTIKAKAYDAAGNISEVTKTVTIPLAPSAPKSLIKKNIIK